MQQQWLWIWKIMQVGMLFVFCGCVTETERVPYYQYYSPDQEESVLDELKREFGWKKNAQGKTEAPYTRAARSIKETVSDWFNTEEIGGATEWQKSMRQLQHEREEAKYRFQEQQEQSEIQRMIEEAQGAQKGADDESRE